MKQSMTRIRTSHVGRLPPPKGWEDMPARLANAEVTDPASIAAQVTPAITETVRKQVEAGIDCVLGNGEEEEEIEAAESKEDAELRHTLLSPLMQHSAAKRLLQREVLNRAILGTLIQLSMETQPPAPVSGRAPAGQADRAKATPAS